MAITAIPRNKITKETGWNFAGARILRKIIGANARIADYAGCYIPAKEAREYGNAINAYTDANPNHEDYAWLKNKAKFFLECQGFWQT